MWNAGLNESKIAGRNNNLRYAGDTILKVENERELKSFLIKIHGVVKSRTQLSDWTELNLMKVKGEWKSWIKTQHSED